MPHEFRKVTLQIDASVFSKIVHWMDKDANLTTTGLDMRAAVTINGILMISFGMNKVIINNILTRNNMVLLLYDRQIFR